MSEKSADAGRSKPEKDRSTECKILDEAEDGPTLPEGEKRPKPGQASARGMQTGAENDLTESGHQTEDR
jgi:hypothetical protein